MKNVFCFFVIFISTMSCRTAQKDIVSGPKAEQAADVSKTIGKVSHQFRVTGCATVIVVAGTSPPLILIPKNKLPDNMDVNGLEISFNYRKLKMPLPVGCSKGIPAELTDIKKK
jgi:hypothetical protein